ncbi:PUA-like domain-containing protein [Roridomyces roridus]|uniref:PUA-like domain-containing protein n=1 Tax=Roridomyces roridus TaxID=1738132 RepID=A0AAD7C2U2_9AGAR|nr:PUA-like domain-containing protein [Roridomyces roridus]
MPRPDPKIHGDVPGTSVGLLFADRSDVYASGIHGTIEAGIYRSDDPDGAYSIVLNKGYEDDDDQAETIIYTGEGKGKPANGESTKPGKAQQGHQDMKSPGNTALQRNWRSGRPVRVIRGPEGHIRYSPAAGYRYDGLYYVTKVWMEVGKSGYKMCRFELERATDLGQDPLPLHITGEKPEDKFWSPDGVEMLANRKKQKIEKRRSSRGSEDSPNGTCLKARERNSN